MFTCSNYYEQSDDDPDESGDEQSGTEHDESDESDDDQSG